MFGLLVFQKIWRQKLGTIFHKSATLNLFPILIRKIDFVRSKSSDRIISRFLFIMLVEDEKEYREEIIDEIKNLINSVEPTKEVMQKNLEGVLGYKKQ